MSKHDDGGSDDIDIDAVFKQADAEKAEEPQQAITRHEQEPAIRAEPLETVAGLARRTREVGISWAQALVGPGVRENITKGFSRDEAIADRFIVSAMSTIKGNRKLMECSVMSIRESLLTASSLQLDCSGIGGDGYLVPFKGVCKFMPGFQGLARLALRNEKVLDIASKVVYEDDEWEYEEGTEPRIMHRPGRGSVRSDANIVAAYAVAHLAGGGRVQEWMWLDELEKIRKKSKGKDSDAWKHSRSEMYRKCPVRRIVKYLPMNHDLRRGVALHDEADGADSTDDRQPNYAEGARAALAEEPEK